MKKKQLLALALVGAMSAGTAAQMAPATTFAAEEHQEQAKKERTARINFAKANEKLLASDLVKGTTDLKAYLESMADFTKTHNNKMAFSNITAVQEKFADLYAILGSEFSGFTSPKGSVLEFASAQDATFDYTKVTYVNKNLTPNKVVIDKKAKKLEDIKAAAKQIDAKLDREIANQNEIIEEAQARIDAGKDVANATAAKTAAETKLENAKAAKLSLSNAVVSAVYVKEYNRVREMVQTIVDEADAKVKLDNVKNVKNPIILKYENQKYKFDRYADSAEAKARFDELTSKKADKIKEIETFFSAHTKYSGKTIDDIKSVLSVDYVIDKLNDAGEKNVDMYLLSDNVRNVMAQGMDKLFDELKTISDELDMFGGNGNKPRMSTVMASKEKAEVAKEAIANAEEAVKKATEAKTMAMQLGSVGEKAKLSTEAFGTYTLNSELIKNEKARYKKANTALEYARNKFKTDSNNEVLKKAVEDAEKQMVSSYKIIKDLEDANDKLMKSILALNAGIIKGVSNYELEKLAKELQTTKMNLINLAKEYGFNDLEIKIVETPVEGAGTWVKDANGNWFFRNHQGRDLYKNAWAKVDNVWYRFEADGQMMASKWFKDTNNRWYWLNASGRMSEKEWINVNGSWFYAYGNGAIAENEWILVNGTWYYAENGGYVAINKTLNINGVNYSFDASGALK